MPIKEFGEKYNKAIDGYYAKINRERNQYQVNLFTTQAQADMATTFNESMESYFTIDENGNRKALKDGLPKNTTIKQVIGGVPGNNQSKMGYKVILSDGSRKWVFPNNDPTTLRMNKYYILNNLADKNSDYAESLKDDLANDIMATFEQTQNVDRNGNRTTKINLGGEDYQGTLRPDGSIVLMDNYGNPTPAFSSSLKLVEIIAKQNKK